MNFFKNFTYRPSWEIRDDWITNSSHISTKNNDILVVKVTRRVKPVVVTSRVVVTVSKIQS